MTEETAHHGATKQPRSNGGSAMPVTRFAHRHGASVRAPCRRFSARSVIFARSVVHPRFGSKANRSDRDGSDAPIQARWKLGVERVSSYL